MKKEILMSKLPNSIFSRSELLNAAQAQDKSFKDTQFRYHLEKLLEKKTIIRVGRNQYKKANCKELKYEYANLYSGESEKIIERMIIRFPLLDFRIWELSWLNEFLNHQIGHNLIFLEVEKEGCEYAFSELSGDYQGRLLLKPTLDQLLLYSIESSIIIDSLVTEAPKGMPMPFNVPLEKLIVDLFASKYLQGIISQADYPMAINEMFAKYKVNQVSLFRYAKRRNKAIVIYDFLKQKTDVEVLVEV